MKRESRRTRTDSTQKRTLSSHGAPVRVLRSISARANTVFCGNSKDVTTCGKTGVRAHMGIMLFFKYAELVGVTVARYHRISTEHQTLDRQTTATEEYVATNYPDHEVRTFADADTGTNTDRDEYQQLMTAVEHGEIDIVVVKEMSRIARSVRDLMRTVDRFRENGVALDFIDDPIEVRPDDDDPTQDLMLQILAAVAEFEAKITQQRVRDGIAARKESDEYHHGPAPLGFAKDDGKLIETPEYDQVCAILEMVANDEMSQREAAGRLDCGRKTVRRAINENGELYGLTE